MWIIVGGETLLLCSMHGFLHGDDPACLSRPSLSHFQAANIDVGRCRETVAGGESKATRPSVPFQVGPGPQTLGPEPKHWAAVPQKPHAWMPHCIGGRHEPNRRKSPHHQPGWRRFPWHHRKEEASLSALSRRTPGSNAPVPILGSLDLQQVACPLISPATRRENMHPLLDSSTRSLSDRARTSQHRHGQP